MPLDIPQYHIDGIDNRIFNSYQMMMNFLERARPSSLDEEIHYHVDYVVQTPDPDEFSWVKKK